MRIPLRVVLSIFLILSTSACGTADVPGTGPEPVRLGDAFYNRNKDLFTLSVLKADLVDTLNAPGPLTMFVPNDEALERMLTTLDTTEEEFLARDDLAEFVLNHVVEGDIGPNDFTDGTLQTLAGGTLIIDVQEREVLINGVDLVNTYVAQIINGQLHLIDGVLLPAGFTEAD